MLLMGLLMLIFCVPDGGLSININTISEEELKNITDLKASPKFIQLVQVEFSGIDVEDIDGTGMFSILVYQLEIVFYGPFHLVLLFRIQL